jgi:hypothetical protein
MRKFDAGFAVEQCQSDVYIFGLILNRPYTYTGARPPLAIIVN